jgi:lipopolysaccharide export system protein LptA
MKFITDSAQKKPDLNRAMHSTHSFQYMLIVLCSTVSICVAQKTVSADTTHIPDTAALPSDSSDELISDSADTESPAIKKMSKDTVKYDADIIEYDVQTKVLLLTGNGMVHYGGMVLYADTIHYVIEKKTFIATGHPMLIDAGDTVAGQSMSYNMETRRGRVQVASATSDDTRYNGELIAKSDSSTYYIEDGDYTSCTDIDTPHYAFYGKTIKVEPGKRAITRPVILNIAQAPSAALPYYVLPLTRGRQSGWLRPRWGGNPSSKGYMDNIGYYWAPNDYMDYTLAAKITEFQNVVFSGSSGYALRYWLNGGIQGRWAQQGDFRTRTQQWTLNFSHSQFLLPDQSFTLSGSGSVLSDRTFYRNFSEDTTELLNQNITANLALSKRFQKINASANLSWQRSHNLKSNMVNEDLPSVNFSLPSRPLFPQKETPRGTAAPDDDETRWFNKIYYGYAIRALQKRNFSMDSSDQTMQIHRGANHSINLSSPQKVLKYLTVSPNFSFGQSLFDAYIDTTLRQGTKRITLVDTVNQPGLLDVIVDSTGADTSIRYVVHRDTSIDYTWHDTTYWWSDNYSLTDAETHSWSAGVNMSTNLYGMFPIRVFNFAGLRHTLTPTVGYTYYPPIESELSYPSFGIQADAARHGRQSVSLSLGNLFQGKIIKPPKKAGDKPEEKKFSIISSSVTTSYNYTNEDDKKWNGKWSDVGLSAGTAYKVFNVSYSSSYSLYKGDDELDRPVLMQYSVSLRPQSLNAGGTLWGGDLMALEGFGDSADAASGPLSSPTWRLGMSPSYNFSRVRKEREKKDFETKKDYHLTMSLNLNFTKKWSMSTGGYYNFMSNKFEGLSFAFDCDLECWSLDFNWYPSGWNSGSFSFNVAIKRHPDIHWELDR